MGRLEAWLTNASNAGCFTEKSVGRVEVVVPGRTFARNARKRVRGRIEQGAGMSEEQEFQHDTQMSSHEMSSVRNCLESAFATFLTLLAGLC